MPKVDVQVTLSMAQYFILVLGFSLLVADGRASNLGEFHIKVTGADLAALQIALSDGRTHRTASPNDTIVLDLPPQLVLDKTIVLGRSDSGRPGATLILRGASPGGTVISGATALRQLPPDAVSASDIARMPESVRNKVRVYSLIDVSTFIKPAFSAYSSFKPTSPGKLFVFEGEQRLTPARWPADGFLQNPIAVPNGEANLFTLKLKDMPQNIDAEHEAWVDGYWGWNWWYEHSPVKSFANGLATMPRPEAPLRPTARFAFLNVAAGLDGPGKVYVNEATQRIYLVPSGPTAPDPTVPVIGTLLHIEQAENIIVEGIAFEKSIGSTVSIDRSSHVALRRCWIGHSGTFGVSIDGSDNHVEACTISDTGYAGVAVGGGDIETLRPSGDVVENCRITHFGSVLPSYQPGIRIGGVGVTVIGNEIADAPHAGIIFSGNDHHIVANVLHDVVLDSDDAGAIYGGRNWSSRGTVVASNYFYNIRNRIGANFVRGVYLDDQLSGITVTNNVFVNVDETILVGGGRDNIVEGNLGLHGRGPAIRVDQRGLGWQAEMVQPNGTLWKSIQFNAEKASLYDSHYPGFATTLTDRPGAPVGNKFINNRADKQPVIAYEPPNTFGFGIETGTATIDAPAETFPDSIAPIARSDPAFSGLEETRRLIVATRERLKSLPFREKARQ